MLVLVLVLVLVLLRYNPPPPHLAPGVWRAARSRSRPMTCTAKYKITSSKF